MEVDWGQVFQQKNLKVTNSIINVFISKLRFIRQMRSFYHAEIGS